VRVTTAFNRLLRLPGATVIDGGCGSADSLNFSWRCGCSPNACQVLHTAFCVSPSSAASDRVDQCVAFFGERSSV